MSFSNGIKSVLDSVYSSKLLSAYQLNLGYIFHAEQLHNDLLFNQMVQFCIDYKDLTGVMPIATVATPNNELLKKQLSESNFDAADYPQRLRLLSAHATIGYHGHFYFHHSAEYYNGMHCTQYNADELILQLSNDLQWFSQNNIEHNGIYAAGWWFMNEVLADYLLKQGFSVDFSFSRSPYFYNSFSCRIMNAHKIRAGESFYLQNDSGKKMLCIQNYVGTHNSPFRIDIDRPLKRLFERNNLVVPNTGVLNTHDYDLNASRVLPYLRHLKENANAQFFSFESLRKLAAHQASKTVII